MIDYQSTFTYQSIDVELFSLFSFPFWTNFVPVCYLFWTFPQIFSDVWKEMYVARDIFSLFLLHLCRKLQRRAPFWGQSGRKSFTTKTFPALTLPPLLCFQLPMTFMFNLPDAVLLLFCQPSLQSEDFARLDRKTFVTLERTVHICILKAKCSGKWISLLMGNGLDKAHLFRGPIIWPTFVIVYTAV